MHEPTSHGYRSSLLPESPSSKHLALMLARHPDHVMIYRPPNDPIPQLVSDRAYCGDSAEYEEDGAAGAILLADNGTGRGIRTAQNIVRAAKHNDGGY